VSGTGEIRDLGDFTGLLQDLSPDGTQALFGFAGGGVTSALLRGTDEERAPKKVVDTGEEITGESFSPDGRWIAYSVRQRAERTANIYVQPFPGPGFTKADRGSHST
jgi:Tol biopolymer transport system component